MNKEYVIMTIIGPPFPADPLPGEAIELRILDLACDRCRHELERFYQPPKRVLVKCDNHKSLNVLQSRRAFEELTHQQLELFPLEGKVQTQPVV